MADTQESGAYGYSDDEEAIGSGAGGLDFGLNTPIFLKKFEYITNGGAGGAEGEALDIVFLAADKERGYRQFPVTKAFGKDNVEITDPKAPEMKEAFKNLGAIITHIVHCFVDKGVIIAALSRPFPDFKTYCGVLQGLLPVGYDQIALDGFAQYQWAIKGENDKTYLEFPKSMKQGRWLVKAIVPLAVDGTPSTLGWKEVRAENPKDSQTDALKYVDEAGNIHPFVRGGWFVNSSYAIQKRQDDSSNDNVNLGASTDAGAPTTAKGW